jgi:hypothetical protein
LYEDRRADDGADHQGGRRGESNRPLQHRRAILSGSRGSTGSRGAKGIVLSEFQVFEVSNRWNRD